MAVQRTESERRAPFVPETLLTEPAPPRWLKRLDTQRLIEHARQGETQQAEAGLELLRRATRKANLCLTDRQRDEARARLKDLDDDRT